MEWERQTIENNLSDDEEEGAKEVKWRGMTASLSHIKQMSRAEVQIAFSRTFPT